MQESPEIEALVRRGFEALYVNHDVAAFRNIFVGSNHPNTRMILVAEAEWYQGMNSTLLQELAMNRAVQLGTADVEFEQLEAFEHGDTGWMAANVVMYRTTGEPTTGRFTATYIMEEGQWRIVQWHASAGVIPADIWGVELTSDIDDLVSSLDASAGAAIAGSSPSGTVTLLFSDVENSTELSDSLGDKAWAQLIGDHLDSLGTSVQAHRGTLVKTLGDGAMAAFASVTDALECALDLQRQASELSFKVRIGLHTGDAIHADGDYVGVTVNKAARIASAAQPGEIAISSVTAEMARGRGYALGSSRTVELKGLPGAHLVTQLAGLPTT
jgi:adenylate cyclase